MITPPKNIEEFSALLEVVKALRSENGCPWDKEQTHQSLTTFAIEEAHELAEAIELGNREEIVSELGDLLLQVALHSEIGRACTDPQMNFTIMDVIRSINEKMIRRHPHVFAFEKAESADEVLKNWAEIKRLEKVNKIKKISEGFEIPPNLPALMRSQKIGDKTKAHNFDWQNPRQVIEKVEEELLELKNALFDLERSPQSTAELNKAVLNEMGDVLFSCAQLARHLKLDAEQTLRVANQRFERRFFKMLELVRLKPQGALNPSSVELEVLWKEVKNLEKQGQI